MMPAMAAPVRRKRVHVVVIFMSRKLSTKKVNDNRFFLNRSCGFYLISA